MPALLVGVVVADRVWVPVRRAEQALALAARDDGAEHLAQDLHQLGVCGLDRVLRGHRNGGGKTFYSGGGTGGKATRKRPVARPERDRPMRAPEAPGQHQRQARPPVEPPPP